MKKERVVKTSRLKDLENKIGIIEKSKDYLMKELSKIRVRETELKERLRKEKQAVSLMNKAKKLRNPGK
jgi:hypothetical protein